MKLSSQVAMQPVAIIGAGAWGTALAVSLVKAGISVRLWGRSASRIRRYEEAGVNLDYLPQVALPSELKLYHELGPCLTGCEHLIIAVPSLSFCEILSEIVAYTKSKAVSLTVATKGFCPDDGTFLSDKAREILPNLADYAVLSGPTFAAEMACGQPTAFSVSCRSIDFAQHVAETFHYGHIRVYTNTDILGTQLAGAFKNIFAIAAGITVGLGYGDNARAAMITRCLSEMKRLIPRLGGKLHTVFGLAGIGDLLLSATSCQSRNYCYGLAIGQGKSHEAALETVGRVVEGFYAVKHIARLAQTQACDIPISQAVYDILYHKLPPKMAVDNLFQRPQREED